MKRPRNGTFALALTTTLVALAGLSGLLGTAQAQEQKCWMGRETVTDPYCKEEHTDPTRGCTRYYFPQKVGTVDDCSHYMFINAVTSTSDFAFSSPYYENEQTYFDITWPPSFFDSSSALTSVQGTVLITLLDTQLGVATPDYTVYFTLLLTLTRTDLGKFEYKIEEINTADHFDQYEKVDFQWDTSFSLTDAFDSVCLGMASPLTVTLPKMPPWYRWRYNLQIRSNVPTQTACSDQNEWCINDLDTMKQDGTTYQVTAGGSPFTEDRANWNQIQLSFNANYDGNFFQIIGETLQVYLYLQNADDLLEEYAINYGFLIKPNCFCYQENASGVGLSLDLTTDLDDGRSYSFTDSDGFMYSLLGTDFSAGSSSPCTAAGDTCYNHLMKQLNYYNTLVGNFPVEVGQEDSPQSFVSETGAKIAGGLLQSEYACPFYFNVTNQELYDGGSGTWRSCQDSDYQGTDYSGYPMPLQFDSDGFTIGYRNNLECLGWKAYKLRVTFELSLNGYRNQTISSLFTVCQYTAALVFEKDYFGIEMTEQIQVDHTLSSFNQPTIISIPQLVCGCGDVVLYEVQSAMLRGTEASVVQDVTSDSPSWPQVSFEASTGQVIVGAGEPSADSFGTRLELLVRAFAQDDYSWWNETAIAINLLKPACSLTSATLELAAGSDLEIDLRAMKGVSTDEADFSSYYELAQEAFANAQGASDCGEMAYALVDESAQQRDTSFLTMSSEAKTLRLEPLDFHESSRYEQLVLRFYLVNNDSVKLDVRLTAQVDECAPDQAFFASARQSVLYTIGDPTSQVPLPQITYEPNCAANPPIGRLTVLADDEAQETDNLSYLTVNSTEPSLFVARSIDLALLGTTKLFKVQAAIEGSRLPPLSFDLDVIYTTDGPRYDTNTFVLPTLPIALAPLEGQEAEPWSFTMPRVFARDQQVVTEMLIQDSPFSSLFIFYADLDGESLLKLDPTFELQVKQGRTVIAPGAYTLKFRLESDLLGESVTTFQAEAKLSDWLVTKGEDADQDVDNSTESSSIFDASKYFSTSSFEGQTEGVKDASINLPSLTIEQVSLTGLIQVGFSEALVVPTDAKEKIEGDLITADGQIRKTLKLRIETERDGEDVELLVDWSMQRFEAHKMTLQLEDQSLFQPEAGLASNSTILKLTVNNPLLFVRQSDGAFISPDTTEIWSVMPALVRHDFNEQILELAIAVEMAGKGTLLIIVILKFIGNFSMNHLLSTISNLSIITHLMLMQLVYPESTIEFFSTVFGFVTFDLIPTDWLYKLIFSAQVATDDAPYSEEAAQIGYESRYVIANLGSVSLVIAVLPFIHLVYFGLQKCTRPGSKVHAFARGKREAFFYGGLIDFFDELYICLSYACIINSSRPRFDESTGLTINNIFAVMACAGLVFGPLFILRGLHKAWKRTQTQTKSEQSPSQQQPPEESKEGGQEEQDPARETQVPGQEASVLAQAEQRSIEPKQVKEPEDSSPNPEDEEEEEEEADPVVALYGSIAESIPGPEKLGRKTALTFVGLKFYRTFLMAAAILWFFSMPVVQVLVTLSLQLAYLFFIAGNPVFLSRSERRAELINESIVVLNIYFLLCLTGAYIGDETMRYDLGAMLVAVNSLNFLISLAPMLLTETRCLACLKRRVQACAASERQAEEWLAANRDSVAQAKQQMQQAVKAKYKLGHAEDMQVIQEEDSEDESESESESDDQDQIDASGNAEPQSDQKQGKGKPSDSIMDIKSVMAPKPILLKEESVPMRPVPVSNFIRHLNIPLKAKQPQILRQETTVGKQLVAAVTVKQKASAFKRPADHFIQTSLAPQSKIECEDNQLEQWVKLTKSNLKKELSSFIKLKQQAEAELDSQDSTFDYDLKIRSRMLLISDISKQISLIQEFTKIESMPRDRPSYKVPGSRVERDFALRKFCHEHNIRVPSILRWLTNEK